MGDVGNSSPPLSSGLISLQIDSSDGQLSSKPPKEITEDAKRFQAQDFLCWGVRADVIAVYQGTHKGKPATLVVFEVRFEFPDTAGSSSRLREAKIVATFKPAPASAQRYPVIRAVCPKLLEGPVRLETHVRETGKTVSLHVGVEPIPVSAEAGLSKTKAVTFDRDQKMSIRGTRWSSKEVEDDDIDNVARWVLAENSALGKGIPLEFRSAVVVENHDAPIHGTVKISAQTKMGMSLFGWPWADTRPIVITRSVQYGQPLGVDADFSKLTALQWEELCQFEGDIATCRWT
ncbi:hypothetical protein F5144DRAFT_585022 [Chaetomium tenue]|uniref:Uncharacterized protein n=1 Tax=Chaetomium tenue TaxID=1854479 RepID=A0ACB7NW14_9PEZI|nr:hypothetical protein F5144DRAFT_585022 [Chaetomium globosum]